MYIKLNKDHQAGAISLKKGDIVKVTTALGNELMFKGIASASTREEKYENAKAENDNTPEHKD